MEPSWSVLASVKEQERSEHDALKEATGGMPTTVTSCVVYAYTAQLITVVGIPPVASFSASCSERSCSFTDASTDQDGSIVSRSWTFGDGYSATVQNPVHTYGAAGSYTVTLTVTDDNGLT